MFLRTFYDLYARCNALSDVYLYTVENRAVRRRVVAAVELIVTYRLNSTFGNGNAIKSKPDALSIVYGLWMFNA